MTVHVPPDDGSPSSGLMTIDADADSVVWVTDLPDRGVDAATAQLRQRILVPSLLTRLTLALRLAR
jgi:hypothetical protein